MSVYKIDADYNPAGPVLNDADDDFPARLQVATKHSFGELRLSRDDFASVLSTVAEAVDSMEPTECEIDGGAFKINAAPPMADDTWELEMQKERLQYKFPVTEDELEGLYDLLRAVHPDHEPEDNPNVEVHA